jgi:hypothetical protein
MHAVFAPNQKLVDFARIIEDVFPPQVASQPTYWRDRIYAGAGSSSESDLRTPHRDRLSAGGPALSANRSPYDREFVKRRGPLALALVLARPCFPPAFEIRPSRPPLY